jgi:uncharacterized protein YabE (DUF348 family)
MTQPNKLVGGLLLLLVLGGGFWFVQRGQRSLTAAKKSFSFSIGGVLFPVESTKGTVGEALTEAGFDATARSIPQKEAPLYAGMIVTVQMPKTIALETENGKEEKQVFAETVEEALSEAVISLGETDLVEPAREVSVTDRMSIAVTRVSVTEEPVEDIIPFEKIETEDDSVSWQTKKVVQKGVAGKRARVYKVSRHNGKIVEKKLLREEILAEAIPEKTVIGTKVTVGKSHTGGASWYAHTGTLAAANPWLPMGSYVRVTNTGNGKSVIVRINDRGPFGKGRIIDLDKVAFAKIADLGTGVIQVKMEEIK